MVDYDKVIKGILPGADRPVPIKSLTSTVGKLANDVVVLRELADLTVSLSSLRTPRRPNGRPQRRPGTPAVGT